MTTLIKNGNGRPYERMAYTELYPHPLRAGLYVLSLKGTPLHYIDTKAKCRVMQERWEKKASEKFNKKGE